MKILYMTPKQYAAYWDIHYNTVYNWIHKGILKNVKAERIYERYRYYIPLGTLPPRPFPGPPKNRRTPEGIHKDCEQLPGQLSVDDLPWTPEG